MNKAGFWSCTPHQYQCGLSHYQPTILWLRAGNWGEWLCQACTEWGGEHPVRFIHLFTLQPKTTSIIYRTCMSISTGHTQWPGGGEGAGMTCGPIDTTFEVVDRVYTWLHGACLTESTWNSLGRHSKGTCPVINAQQTRITRQCAGHMDTWRSQVSAYSLTCNRVEKTTTGST